MRDGACMVVFQNPPSKPHTIPILLQQGLEAGVVAEGTLDAAPEGAA
jgi:hypothetical protein